MSARLVRGSRAWWLAGLLTTLLATTPAWWAWLLPDLNLWVVDDAKNHLLRLYALDWTIRHGVWLPRWLPDLYLGYGYPVFNYYAPGFYYLALALRGILRVDLWDAYRLAGVAAALAGAAGTYALVVAVWRRASLGVLASMVVLYGPYVVQTNLYKRGDIPEALGLALVPWLLLCLWRSWLAPAAAPRNAWTFGAAAVGAALILVHNLTSLLAAAVAAVWVLYLFALAPGRHRLVHTLLAGGLAAGLAAFFWLPALGERQYVHLERLRVENLDYRVWLVDPSGQSRQQQSPKNRQTRAGLIDLHLHYPHQLVAGPKLSLAQAGLAVIATAGLTARLWQAYDSRQARVASWAIAPLLLVSAGCWLLTFTWSAPLWERVPGLPLLQFPWRLLGPLGICLAAAAAGALAAPLTSLERRWPEFGRPIGWMVAGCVAGVVVFNSVGDRSIPVEDLTTRTIDGAALVADESKDRLGFGSTSAGEFLPRDVDIAVYTEGFPRDNQVYERLYPEREWLGGVMFPLAGALHFVNWRSGPLWLSARVAADGGEPGQIGIHQLRFPGWRAWVDGVPAPIGVPPYVEEQQAGVGFMVITIPPGEHTLVVQFGPTPLRLTGTIITVVSALIGGIAACWLLRQRGLPPMLLLAGSVVLAGVLGHLVWRDLRPLFPRAPVPALPQVAEGIWQAPDLTIKGAGLVVNLAEAVRTGQARVESPSGRALGPGQFLDVRQLTVTDLHDSERGAAATSRRQWLYEHPPSHIAVDVAVPPRRDVVLQAALALDPAVWTAAMGDGVRFQALVAALDSAEHESAPVLVVDEVVNPRADTEQRRWLPVEADLSRWAGATIRLTLQTLPRDDLANDWAGWANPVVVVRDTARAHAPAAGVSSGTK